MLNNQDIIKISQKVWTKGGADITKLLVIKNTSPPTYLYFICIKYKYWAIKISYGHKYKYKYRETKEGRTLENDWAIKISPLRLPTTRQKADRESISALRNIFVELRLKYICKTALEIFLYCSTKIFARHKVYKRVE